MTLRGRGSASPVPDHRTAGARLPTFFALAAIFFASLAAAASSSSRRFTPVGVANAVAPGAGAADLKNESMRIWLPPVRDFFSFAMPLLTRSALKPCRGVGGVRHGGR